MTTLELLPGYDDGDRDFRSADLLTAFLTWAEPDWADLVLPNLTGTSLAEEGATKVKVALPLLATPSSPVWGQPRLPDALSGSRVVNRWLRTGYATGNGDGGER